jgi:hypothetical protein
MTPERHPAFRPMTHRGPLDEDRPLTPRRLQAMRERYFCPERLKRCECGGCGLYFPVATSRRFHPQCPSKRGERAKKTGKLYKDRDLLAGPPRPNRCELCEDLPHRRARPRCLVCDKPFADETLERDEANVGCGIGGL